MAVSDFTDDEAPVLEGEAHLERKLPGDASFDQIAEGVRKRAQTAGSELRRGTITWDMGCEKHI